VKVYRVAQFGLNVSVSSQSRREEEAEQTTGYEKEPACRG